MAKYYALVSGLPDLTVDSQKLPFGQEEFYQELCSVLSGSDKTLLEALRLEQVNAKVLDLLRSGGLDPEKEYSELAEEELPLAKDLLEALQRVALQAREEQAFKPVKAVPRYLARFVYDYFLAEDSELRVEGQSYLNLEDQLAQAYYQEMTAIKSKFLSQWFTLNQVLRNVLVLHTCRKLNWDESKFIVGTSELEEKIKTSKARDFDLAEEVPNILEIVQIAEEKDIAKRERMIDVLKWRWLEEVTFAKIFDIDNVLAYYLRLGIVERWLKLDKETGEQVFRNIVFGLKRESNKSLEEFKNSIKR